MELFETPEPLSLTQPNDPFLEIYEGQHIGYYKAQEAVPVREAKPGKVNLNNANDPKRQLHIEQLRSRLKKKMARK